MHQTNSFLFMKKNLLIILSVVIIFHLTSCKKAIEVEIEGDWKKMDMTNPLASSYEMWHIKEGAFYIVKVSSSGAQTQLYKGEYIIKNKIYLFQRLFSIFPFLTTYHNHYIKYFEQTLVLLL